MMCDKYTDLRKRIQEAINCTNAESGSNTPDFILATYLVDCLRVFDKVMVARSTTCRTEQPASPASPLDGIVPNMIEWNEPKPEPARDMLMFQVDVSTNGLTTNGLPTEPHTYIGYCSDDSFDMLTCDGEDVGWQWQDVDRWIELSTVLNMIKARLKELH